MLQAEAMAGRLDPEAAAAVIEAAGLPRPRSAWPNGLTDREVDVLGLAARGLSNKQIAAALVVCPRTVQNHVQNTLGKLHLHNRVELVRFALARGLEDGPGAADG